MRRKFYRPDHSDGQRQTDKSINLRGKENDTRKYKVKKKTIARQSPLGSIL
jgi:hypothetical protein